MFTDAVLTWPLRGGRTRRIGQLVSHIPMSVEQQPDLTMCRSLAAIDPKNFGGAREQAEHGPLEWHRQAGAVHVVSQAEAGGYEWG